MTYVGRILHFSKLFMSEGGKREGKRYLKLNQCSMGYSNAFRTLYLEWCNMV